MLGQGGLFQQQNIEKRKTLSVREWAELCARDDFRAPGVEEVGPHARANNAGARARTRRSRRNATAGVEARDSETAEPEPVHATIDVKHEDDDERVPPDPASSLISPPHSNRALSPVDNDAEKPPQSKSTSPAPNPTASDPRHPLAQEEEEEEEVKDVARAETDIRPKKKGRATQSKEVKEAQLAENARKDREFLESFDPRTSWLPPKTQPSSYTKEFCKDLERQYWRNCGWGKAPWYGADMQGVCQDLSSVRRSVH